MVAVDRYAATESDEFQPLKRTKLYGITTAYAQCPSGIKTIMGLQQDHMFILKTFGAIKVLTLF